MDSRLSVEVMEMILNNMSETDVLCAQRVSRRWNAIIRSSPSLQKKLWFRAGLTVNECDPEETFLISEVARRALRPYHVFLERFPRYRDDCLIAGVVHEDTLAWIPERISRPEASWRRMLLTQPAVTRNVYVRISQRVAGRPGERTLVRQGPYSNGEGVRLGDCFPV
jgi:hypothetical protein